MAGYLDGSISVLRSRHWVRWITHRRKTYAKRRIEAELRTVRIVATDAIGAEQHCDVAVDVLCQLILRTFANIPAFAINKQPRQKNDVCCNHDSQVTRFRES